MQGNAPPFCGVLNLFTVGCTVECPILGSRSGSNRFFIVTLKITEKFQKKVGFFNLVAVRITVFFQNGHFQTSNATEVIIESKI